jgi:hypothetical protein
MRSRIIATGLAAALTAGFAGTAAAKPVSRAAALEEQAALMRAWARQEGGAWARGVAADEAAARRAAPLHADSVPGGHGGT